MSLIRLAVLGAAGYAAWRGVKAYGAQRRGREMAEPVQRWEGEGGAVPVGGSRIAADAGVAPGSGVGLEAAPQSTPGTDAGLQRDGRDLAAPPGATRDPTLDRSLPLD